MRALITQLKLLDKSEHYVTPSITSHEILTMKLEVYPPSSRDDADIGMLNVEILVQVTLKEKQRFSSPSIERLVFLQKCSQIQMEAI